MEKRVDENNRSLLPNPFVSTVIIHSSTPPPPQPPHPTHPPSLSPASAPLHSPLPAHKQPAAVLKPILVPPDSRAEAQKQPQKLPVNPATLAQLCPCFHPVHPCGHWEHVYIRFLCERLQKNILHRHVNACVLETAKYCFPFSVYFAFTRLRLFVLLCFVLATVHAMHLRATPSLPCKCFCCVSWSCLRAVRARGEVERAVGEGSGCQGKRRLCLMRSRPGNPVTPPTQPPPPPPHYCHPYTISSLGECTPPPPPFTLCQRERSPWC